MADPTEFAAYVSPMVIYLILGVWGAVLGLSAILVGTLCDERAARINELHEAYVGVAEVLSRYMQIEKITHTKKDIQVFTFHGFIIFSLCHVNILIMSC